MLFFPPPYIYIIYMCEGGSNFDLFFVLVFFPSLFLTRYRRVWRMVVRVDRKGRQPTGGVSAASHHHGPVSEYDNPIGRCSPRYRRSSIPYFTHRSLSIPPFDLLFFFSFRRRGREREILSSSIIFQTCFCFQTSAVSYVLLSLLLLLLLSEQGENHYASRIGEIFNRAFWVTIHLFSVIRAARFLMIRDLKAAPWKEKKEGKREGGNCSAPFLSGGGGTAEEG